MTSTNPMNKFGFQSSQSFLSTIQTLQKQLDPILDDFAKYYVFYNKNPDVTEYQQMFSNIKSNLNQLNSQLFMVSNQVDTNTQAISKKLLEFNQKIQSLKTQNGTLSTKMQKIKHKNNSADELINDYKQMYDMGYLRNWGLGLSIVVSCALLSIVFRKTALPITPVSVNPVK
jgi:uncharacterized protein YgiM (DUF1202 family)